ncbi:unnamed protein product [Caenorhabditis brenneri]
MAPRKKPNASKAATRSSPIDPNEAEAKKLMAALKKHKASLSAEMGKTARLTRRHELKKEELKQRIAKMGLSMKEKEKKHLKKMEKLKEETRKAQQHLEQMQVQAAATEPDLDKKLTKELKTLNRNREKCGPAIRRQLAEAVAARGEPFEWQLCEICIEPYDKGTHAPRTFACGHTVCDECHASILRNNWRAVCPFDRIYVSNTEHHHGSKTNIVLSELCE